MHAECEISIELQYAWLACGCHGHLIAERWVSWGVSPSLLRELSNDVVTVCNRGDSSDIRRVSQAELLLSAGIPAAKFTAAHTYSYQRCLPETFSLSNQLQCCHKPTPEAGDNEFSLCEILMPYFPIHCIDFLTQDATQTRLQAGKSVLILAFQRKKICRIPLGM